MLYILIDPAEPISKIVQGWKSFTARWLLAHNERLGLGIPDLHHVWIREYWDRYIRDDNHLRATVDYIHRNPVKACLCQDPGDWPWSSAGRADVRRADVLVGLANGKANDQANDQATGDTSLAPHSHANEDVGVPGKDAGAT